jgi:Polyketide cyclase / dehydrase and lipid transport
LAESYHPVRYSIVMMLILMAAPACCENMARDAALDGDIEVTVVLDAAGQSGNARATVRIHARREVVWSLITSCPESMAMVPGLEVCQVLETAPDRTWQRIRHVMNYSWYIPKVTYEIRALYDRPSRVSIERVAGDLRDLRGSWDLQSDGDYTIAHYSVELIPGFWVPQWLVRSALRRDLPKMLRALRTRAEALQALNR